MQIKLMIDTEVTSKYDFDRCVEALRALLEENWAPSAESDSAAEDAPPTGGIDAGALEDAREAGKELKEIVNELTPETVEKLAKVTFGPEAQRVWDPAEVEASELPKLLDYIRRKTIAITRQECQQMLRKMLETYDDQEAGKKDIKKILNSKRFASCSPGDYPRIFADVDTLYKSKRQGGLNV